MRLKIIFFWVYSGDFRSTFQILGYLGDFRCAGHPVWRTSFWIKKFEITNFGIFIL